MKGVITVAHIMSVAAEVWGVSVSDIQSTRRAQPIVEARFATAGLARELTTASYTIIGRALCDLDHTRALHGASRAAELVASDPAFALRYETARMTLSIMERASLTHLIESVDPVAVARRIDEAPRRAAMLATDAEIAAMAALIVKTFGPDDGEPLALSLTQDLETEHAA
ncbi:MAG: hypothetical protein HEQ16_05155 [Bosea sp.]|jgi:hypothetical protein|nr:hypothetical protein [Bosea sp. (in: a-proteobacteria)]